MKFGEDFFKKHNWDEIQDFYNSGHKWKEILKKFKISNKGLTLAIKNGWFKTRGRSESMKILLKNNPRKHTDETKRKISEIRKKYLEENPNKVPYLLNHSRDESYPEKYFKNVFDNEGILVVRYFRIGLYELDFCIPEKKIDIEIDGCQHYLDEKIKISDEIRNKFLMEQGWDIIRIIWSDYQKMDSESKLKFIRELKEYINGLVQNKPTIVIKDKQICDCGKKKYRYSKKCQDCSIIERRIVERPNIEILLKEIDEMGYCATGRKYGVSDNTIRKWSKNIKKKMSQISNMPTSGGFSATLSSIQSHLQENLPSGTRRVWVDGNTKGFANLCITVFPTVGEYHFIFHRINNFRNISPTMTDEEISEIVSGYVIEIRDLIDRWVGLDD